MQTLLKDERGSSLIISMMAIMLMTGLGIALVLTTNTETMISSNYRGAQETMYAADAGIERSIQDLLRVPTWTSVLQGEKSGFLDDPPRVLPDGTNIDNLTPLTTTVQNDSNAIYGATNANRPVWVPYAYGPLSQLLPTDTVQANDYVLVWVADDPSETDNDPTLDSNGTVLMHAEAYGEGGARKVIEATVVRTMNNEIERGYIAQRGQDEQNRRARKAAVQTPGKSLTQMELDLGVGGLVVK